MPRYFHYSSTPITKIKSITVDTKRETSICREAEARLLGYKPYGFWISVEARGYYDWKKWCKAEEYHLDGLKYRYEIIIDPAAKILVIDTLDKLYAFNEAYKIQYVVGLKSIPNMYTIDWKRLYKEYDGIIIAPYQWKARFDPHWYYGWDCASGCIWNHSIISIKK